MTKKLIPRRIIERNRWLRSDGKPNFKTSIHKVTHELEPLIIKDLETLTPTSTILSASEIMSRLAIRLLPITSAKGKLLGIVTAMDIISLLNTLQIHNFRLGTDDIRTIYKLVNLPIRRISNDNPLVANIKAKLGDVLEFMILNNLGNVPVVDDELRFKGLLSESTIVKYLCDKITGVKAFEVMSRELITVSDESRVKDIISTMVTCGVRRLPIITKDGSVKGVITWKNIIDLIGRHDIFNILKYELVEEFLNLRLSDLSFEKPFYVYDDDDIGLIATKMRLLGLDYALVVDVAGDLKGIITERDILYGVLVRR